MLEIQRPTTGDRAFNHAQFRDYRPVDIVPFRAWHLDFLNVQPEQWSVRPILSPSYGRALEDAGRAFTAFAGDEVIGCAGIIEFWPGRGQVWAILSNKVEQYQMSVHRAVKQAVDAYAGRRLECVVDPTFERAVRWAKYLGFTRREAEMPAYGIGGEDMTMFVKLNR